MNDYFDNNTENISINENLIIGIDLGTTNSCAAIWRNNNLEIIPDEYGNRTVPSYVAYTNITRYIGHDAKNQKDINTENVFYEVKRLIGRKYDDEHVQDLLELLSYQVHKTETNDIAFISHDKIITPEEISAAVLSRLKNNAKRYLNQDVTDVVITIPAHFTDSQRQATRDAATIAGLNCIRIINEPIAASLAYGLITRSQTHKNKEMKVLVYDFGGGTLDVSILEIDNGTFSVLSSAGISYFGGTDFDNRIMQFCLSVFKKKHNIKSLSISSVNLQKLRIQCENTKKILSTNIKTTIGIKDFYDNKDLLIPITRNDFEKICSDLFIRSIAPIEDALHSAELTIDDIDEVLLVGGMTRIPHIRSIISHKFNKEPNCTINPDEAIAAGAAIQGYILTNKDDPFSESITMLDITSLSLGVELHGGIMGFIVPKHTHIPHSVTKKYTTDTDDSESVIIKIYEGERILCKDNMFLGEFEISGIEPKKRGIPEINVTISIDANGITSVSAIEIDSQNQGSIIVTSNKSRLSQDDINRIIRESKEREAIDELEKNKKMSLYQIKDICEIIIYNLDHENTKLKQDDINIIRNEIKDIEIWLDEKKDRSIEEYTEILNKIRKRYGMLILKQTESSDIKCMGNKTLGTRIHGDDPDDIVIDENIVDDIDKLTNGFSGLSDPEINEIKEMKNNIHNLCYNIFEILDSNKLKLSSDHIDQLKYYIDNVLLWLHINGIDGKPVTINDYKMRIDEINETCDKILSLYDNNVFIVTDIKKELEKMCYAILIMISDKLILSNLEYIKNLINKILKNINEYSEQECNDYIDELNIILNTVNINVNLDNEYQVIKTKDNNSELNTNETFGTSIDNILINRQNDIINDIINDKCTE